MYYTFNSHSEIKNTIKELKQNVDGSDWISANNNYQVLHEDWNRVKYIIELNNGEQNFSNLTEYIQRLGISLSAKQQYESMLYLNLAENYLDNFMKFVPEP